MQTRLKMSREGLELLKEFEGLRLTAAQLPDGRWTMGHGHTQYAREGATITPADAEAFLVYDLIPVVAAVNDDVVPDISQNQFDALVCFAFNVGVDAFAQSEVLQRVNQERMTEAALAMAIWRAGAFNGRRVVLDALVRRRSAEEALMLGREGRESPSDLIRPEIDPAAQAALPAEAPVVIVTHEDGGQLDPQVLASETPQAVEAEVEATPPTPEPEAEPVAETPPAEVSEPESRSEEAGDQEPAPPATDAPLVEPVAQPDATDASIQADPVVQDTAEAPVEPIAEASAEPTGGNLADAAGTERIYQSFSSVPFSPLNAAQPVPQPTETAAEPTSSAPSPQDLVDDSTGLMEPPGPGAQIDEPPLVLVLTPPPEVTVEPPVVASDFSGAEVAPAAETPDQEALFEQGQLASTVSEGDAVIYYEAEPDTEAEPTRWSDIGAYVATGVVGLAAFGFGIAGFQLASQETVAPGSFDEKTVISWGLVAIGVVCVWSGAYNLFKRLGSSQDV